MEDTRENQIRVGQAVNLAFHYAFLSGSVTSPEDAAALARETVPTFLETVNAIQAEHAFPGAEREPAQVIQHPAMQQAQPALQREIPQPAQVPGASSGDPKADAKWQRYFANPNDYYDNRANKRNPNAPDFKHKQTGESLWLAGKWPAPEWVLQRFAQQESF